MSRFKIEPAEEMTGYGCACCNGDGGARGFVYEGETPLAVYFAEAGGMSSKPVVLIGAVIGKWEGETKKEDRVCLAFACSKSEGTFEKEPTIPYLLAYPEFTMLGEKVQPEEAAAHAEFARAGEIVEAIVDQDPRFAHLRPDSAPRRSRFIADAPEAGR